MKTIRITSQTREMIREYANENETVNGTISRLIEDAEPVTKTSSGTTSIHIEEDHLLKLKELKSHSTESLSDVIKRLLVEKGINDS